MKHPFIHTVLAAAVLSTLSFGAHADMSVEERLTAMEARLNAVEAENLALKDKLKSANQKIDATGDQVEKIASAAPSGKAAWAENTRIGGYGELHYTNLNGEGGASDTNEIDFHRFVLFFGHDFSPRTRLFSELEVEHTIVEGGKGAVELEQAYIEHDINDTLSIRGGLFLIPVGIMNETHEPPTFYGVERNPVETAIIPGTWWEGGAGITARLGNGFTLDGALTSGFKGDIADNYAIRDARQELADGSLAKNAAYTGRLKWTGVPGLEVAATLQYQSDFTQGTDPNAGSAWLGETHAVLNRGPFTVKALYAQWNLNGAGPASVGANKQNGWYIEPSYKLSEQWGVFARYNLWDNQAGDNISSKMKQIGAGVNWWLHPDVVVKADYQQQDNDNGENQNGFNLGIGYQF
ncbi:MAG: porin [Thiobacillaceae bacterium]